MHSIIHKEFKSYIVAVHGEKIYQAMLDAAGIANDFVDGVYYEDADLKALLRAGEAITGKSPRMLLYEYGVNVSPKLFDGFKGMMKPEWNTLDFLENSERVFHGYVREEMGGLPPVLITRRDDVTLTLDYRSPRRMAGLAHGFIDGMAACFGDKLSVSSTPLGEDGDAACSFTVRVTDSNRLS